MNLTDFNCFSFPGGERHFELDDDSLDKIIRSKDCINASIQCSDDLIDLALATSWLATHGVKPRRLNLPYFPYARQDRVTTQRSPFSLDVAAWFVNSLNYDQVHIYEPHSDVTPGLLRAEVHGCEQVCGKATANITLDGHTRTGKLIYIAPDAGASKRVQKCLDHISSTNADLVIPVLSQALKYRNPTTGKLALGEVYGLCPQGQDFLIVDDICDGGATFVALAKRLRDMGATSVHLFVAHGIFSKGFDVLFSSGIDTIHYTDSRSRVPVRNTEVSSCGRIYKYRCGL